MQPTQNNPGERLMPESIRLPLMLGRFSQIFSTDDHSAKALIPDEKVRDSDDMLLVRKLAGKYRYRDTERGVDHFTLDGLRLSDYQDLGGGQYKVKVNFIAKETPDSQGEAKSFDAILILGDGQGTDDLRKVLVGFELPEESRQLIADLGVNLD